MPEISAPILIDVMVYSPKMVALFVSMTTLITLASYLPEISHIYGHFEIKSSQIAKLVSNENNINYIIIFLFPLTIIGLLSEIFVIISLVPREFMLYYLIFPIVVTFWLTGSIIYNYCNFIDNCASTKDISDVFKGFKDESLLDLFRKL